MMNGVINFFLIRKEPYGEAFRWISVTLIVSLMPLWGSALIFLLLKQHFDLGTFTNKAEFAIYAASYLGGAAHIVMKNFNRKNFPLRPWFFIFILITMIVAAICFAVVYSNNCNVSPLPLNLDFLRVITLWSFFISLLLAFVTFVEDLVLMSPDIFEINAEQFKKISDDFDHLSGGGK